jgi:tetratricopeptide (TPR) repeat protein
MSIHPSRLPLETRMNVWRASRPRWTAGAALLALLLGCLTAPSSATAAAGARVEDAVVSIFVSTLLSNGRGSGFPVGDGSWVVTCYHVVMQQVGDGKELPVEHALVLSPWTGEPLRARVVATDPKADLALLKLERGRLPALPVASAAQFDPASLSSETEKFTIAGFGQTSAQLETDPEVHTGKAPVELLAVAEKVERQVLLFAPSKGAGPGWSGGPVVNAHGQVVGVFRALVAQPQERETWYPLATGVEPLRALLKSRSVAITPTADALPTRAAEAPALFQREFRGLVWGSGRRWDRAETERRAEVLLRPNNAIAHLGLSQVLLGQGRLEEALKEVETAITLDTTRAGSFFQKGLILQRLDRLREAEESMRRSLEMEPEAAERRISFGALLAAQGKMAEAVTVLRRATELAPDHPLGHWRLGLCLLGENKAEEAVTALRRAVKLAETLPLRSIRSDLALALQKAGKTDEAEQELRDMARTADDPSVQYELAAFLAAHHKSPEAMEALQKCFTLLEQHADPELQKRANELKSQLEGKSS